MVEPEYVESKLKQAFSDAHVEVYDLTGTKDHYKAVIVTPDFTGKLLIKRHRMVYAALEEEMKGPIHALTLETYAPGERS